MDEEELAAPEEVGAPPEGDVEADVEPEAEPEAPEAGEAEATDDVGAAAEAPEDDPPQDGEEPAEGEEGSAEPAEGDEELLAEAVDGDGEAVEADGEAEPEEPGPEGDAAAAAEQPDAEGEEGAEGASPAPEENASEDPRGGESPVPQEWGEPGAEDEEEGVHAEASERSAVGESPGDEEAAGDRPLSGGHRPSTSTVGSQDPGRPASGGAATRAHFAEEPEPPKPPSRGPDDDGEDAFEDEVLSSMVDPRFAEAVAHRIEGFNDDFRTGESDVESEADVDEEELTLNEAVLESKVKREQLLDLNTLLQAKLAQYLADLRSRVKGSTLEFSLQQGGPESGMAIKMGGLMSEEEKQRIQELLDEWFRAADELDLADRAHGGQVEDLEARLEERKARATEIRAGYRRFAMEVARGAEHSRTGRPIPLAVLRDLESEELGKTEELEALRLKHILYRNRLQKLEHRVRQREQLAEGLMLIDFEQLKIENQSLNEKIEERNEELTKLNRKCQATIQVITHVKEKLQFLEKENEALVHRLAAVDEDLTARREVLQDLKTERQKLRNQVQRIRDRNTNITNPMLLEDFEALRVKRANLESDLARLRGRQKILEMRIKNKSMKLLDSTGHNLGGMGQSSRSIGLQGTGKRG